jgi:hypothetical protein
MKFLNEFSKIQAQKSKGQKSERGFIPLAFALTFGLFLYIITKNIF